MPLKALLDNKPVFAADLDISDRTKKYYCPICKDSFIVVLPKSCRIKHFRHTTGRAHGEPESAEHLQLKQCVYDAAKRLGLTVDLEYVVDGEKEYIADVLIVRDDLKIAVECQCSQTSMAYIISKSNFYIANGYIPLWIFGVRWFDNAYFTRQHSGGYGIQRISQIEKLFFRNKRDFFYSDGEENFYKFKDFKFRWAKGGDYLYSEYLGWYSITQTFIEHIILHTLSSSSSRYKYVIPCLLYARFCGECSTCSEIYISPHFYSSRFQSFFDNRNYKKSVRSCLNCGFTYEDSKKEDGYFLSKQKKSELIDRLVPTEAIPDEVQP